MTAFLLGTCILLAGIFTGCGNAPQCGTVPAQDKDLPVIQQRADSFLPATAGEILGHWKGRLR